VAPRQTDQRYGNEDPDAERYDQWIRYLSSAPRQEITGLFEPRTVRRPAPPVMRRPPPRMESRTVPAAGPGYPGGRMQVWHDMVYTDWVTRRTGGYPLVEPREQRYFLATFGWTAAWYAVPAAVFTAWTLRFPGTAGTACARPVGNACPAPRAAALQAVLHGLPRLGIALAVALLVAGLIRWGSAAWRPVVTGFAAAVVGAGLTTVLYSAMQGG
jgi:hypothetical protein